MEEFKSLFIKEFIYHTQLFLALGDFAQPI